ncbi:MAG: TatD family hydrolase, partial [Firmicutes bacterium]|nr:TatD family hydrolase [Bacillota bacterium]
DVTAVIERARSKSIVWLINIGYDVESSRKAIRQASLYPDVKATVGIHPHDASTLTKASLSELESLATSESVVAFGEIGLDYYYDNSPRDVQREAFSLQMKLAKELKLPVVIHSRDATNDTLEILREYAPLQGIMHCFSGSLETAQICMDLGLHIAFGGAITFKNAPRLRKVVEGVSWDRILVETDCPYLSPEPLRGRRNEPAYLQYTLAKLAEIKQVSLEEAARISTENARTVFDLD